MANSEPSASPPEPPPKRRILKRLLLVLGTLLGVVILLGLAGGLWLWSRLSDALPPLEGERLTEGIERPVVVERDALGVVTLRGSSRRDIAFATGFVHAQDRFFQMDLYRRQAAGELAELLGAPLLRFDRARRPHRFRALAGRLVAGMDAAERALLEAYAAGVNAGLASLGAPPFEYLALRAEPAPWQAEDTLLVSLVMFVVLLDDGDDEALQTLMHERLPPALYEFLTPLGTPWDAPMMGEPLAWPAVPAADSRPAGAAATAHRPAAADVAFPAVLAGSQEASNAWAVAGHRTADGRALLAVDTHTGLAVPNIWYRASFVWPEAGEGEHRVTGVTLPGTPAMVIGSNGHVAWGFTNARIDAADLVRVQRDPANADAYLTPEGPEPFEHFREILRTRSGDEEVLDVVWTRWGPLVDEDSAGRPRALRWIPHEPEALALDFRLLEEAHDVDQALEIAQRNGLPPQNLVAADASGRIAWTIAGRLPRRRGLDGRLTASWADGCCAWDGWLPPAEVPRIVDPPSGMIWTANNRVVDLATLPRLGLGGSYVLGARARQIRDALARLERATAADMLGLQLDDRSPFLKPWQELLLAALTSEAVADHPRRREARRFVEDWNGHAAVDSVGYRLIREFRDELAARVFGFLLVPCREADPEFDYVDEFKQWEGPLWALVTERPHDLLNPAFASWDEQLLAAFDAVLERAATAGAPLAGHTWGRRNTTEIRHLFSGFLPLLGRWLDMPAEPLPGDRFLPRVQDPDSGASLRMVVSPGREAEGIFHMPGGQSGHFLSAHYRDSHGPWARGEATPFLPGEAVHTLVLKPPSGG